MEYSLSRRVWLSFDDVVFCSTQGRFGISARDMECHFEHFSGVSEKLAQKSGQRRSLTSDLIKAHGNLVDLKSTDTPAFISQKLEEALGQLTAFLNSRSSAFCDSIRSSWLWNQLSPRIPSYSCLVQVLPPTSKWIHSAAFLRIFDWKYSHSPTWWLLTAVKKNKGYTFVTANSPILPLMTCIGTLGPIATVPQKFPSNSSIGEIILIMQRCSKCFFLKIVSFSRDFWAKRWLFFKVILGDKSYSWTRVSIWFRWSWRMDRAQQHVSSEMGGVHRLCS